MVRVEYLVSDKKWDIKESYLRLEFREVLGGVGYRDLGSFFRGEGVSLGLCV